MYFLSVYDYAAGQMPINVYHSTNKVVTVLISRIKDAKNKLYQIVLFFRDDASKKSENGKSLENLKIENTRLLR